MKCPACKKINKRNEGQTTLDSRLSKDGMVRKRSKICLYCNAIYKTIETLRPTKENEKC